LTKTETLKALEINTGVFPREALETAIALRQEIVPDLLGFIAFAHDNARQICDDPGNHFMGHLYAMFLLSQFRETGAYAPIVDLLNSSDARAVHAIVGDTITEDMHRILPSVWDGNDAPIRSLITNAQADEYARGAAIQSFVTMVSTGQKPRDEVIKYYRALFQGGLEREYSHVWNELVSCATDLNPRELFDDIQKVYEEELLDPGYIAIKEIEREKDLPVETSLSRLSLQGNFTLIDDTIAEMEDWACFDRDRSSKRRKPVIHSPVQPVRSEPKTGRNDPCPCGSGKKYKKCCGK